VLAPEDSEDLEDPEDLEDLEDLEDPGGAAASGPAVISLYPSSGSCTLTCSDAEGLSGVRRHLLE